MPTHNPRKENNSANNCNCRFQTEMTTKRQNLRTAALIYEKILIAKFQSVLHIKHSIHMTLIQYFTLFFLIRMEHFVNNVIVICYALSLIPGFFHPNVFNELLFNGDIMWKTNSSGLGTVVTNKDSTDLFSRCLFPWHSQLKNKDCKTNSFETLANAHTINMKFSFKNPIKTFELWNHHILFSSRLCK